MLVKASHQHIAHVCKNIRADDYRELSDTRWSMDDLEQSVLSVPCEKFAVVHENAVALMGVVPAWPGVGQAWLFGTDEIGTYGVEVAHSAKRIIKTLLNLELHRIHAYSAAFHTQAHQWLEMIGFRRESTLKQYGKTGEDFHVYAITRPVSDDS